jgi:hypothetical protein
MPCYYISESYRENSQDSERIGIIFAKKLCKCSFNATIIQTYSIYIDELQPELAPPAKDVLVINCIQT